MTTPTIHTPARVPSASPTPQHFQRAAAIAGGIAMLEIAAIFGFFYAWVCSTLWGLDAIDPRVAIAAMQAMNESVRNPVFFVSFFLTPVALAAAALLAWVSQAQRSAFAFGAAAALYTVGGIILTATFNVPWNEALGALTVPTSAQEAATIWRDYSGKWQVTNLIRTIVSGVCVLITAAGLMMLHRRVSDASPGR